MELYKKHRPKKLSDIIGQSAAVKIVSGWLKKKDVPQSILLTGSSGCGKTTIARILKKELGCDKRQFTELNAAEARGIDTIREIDKQCKLAVIGQSRIWLIDECHKLTNDAQTALLKILEDTPKNVYFLLATTDPHKLIKTIHTRCSTLKLDSLNKNHLLALTVSIANKESKQFSEEVHEKIAECAEGSARKALVILNSIIDIEDEEAQLDLISKNDVKEEAINLVRTLMNPRSQWSDVADILSKTDLEDAESIRYLILGYCSKIILGGGKQAPRAAMVVDMFRDNLFDSKKFGLIANCWEVYSDLRAKSA